NNAAGRSHDAASQYCVAWRNTRESDKQHHERAHVDGKYSVVCRTNPSNKKYEDSDQNNLHSRYGMEESEQRSGEHESGQRSGDAKEPATEGDCKLWFQNESYGHGQPVGSASVD